MRRNQQNNHISGYPRNRQKMLCVGFLCVASLFILSGCSRGEPASWEFQAGTAVVRETEVSTDTPIRSFAEDTQTEEKYRGYVYLCGAVRYPGVYEIEEDTRLFEIVERAGGLSEDADPDWLNQAQKLQDGEKILVLTQQETDLLRKQGISDDGTSDPEISGSGQQGKININTADKEQLMTLSGIGEAKAEAILEYRKKNGAFENIEQICEIPGIKQAVYTKIKDHITV